MLLLGVVLLVLLHGEMSVAKGYESYEKQKEYLEKFEYMGRMSKNPEIQEMVREEDIFKKAVEDFQLMAGIEVTGKVDEETKKYMEKDRCGVADHAKVADFTRRRRKRFAFAGRWDKKQLTWRLNIGTSQLPRGDLLRIFRHAFNIWQQNSPLTFTEVSESQVPDIFIDFAKRDHQDKNPFDGLGNVLAHAFFPNPGLGGDVHFDDEENWTDQKPEGTNLLIVAVHEIGHSLGLSHSNVQGAIMQAFYPGYSVNVQLHKDDIAGIQAIYGKPTTKDGPATSPPKTDGTPNFNEAHFALCELKKIDAITSAENKIMVFAGSKFYLMEGYGNEAKNVQLHDIAKLFPGLKTGSTFFALVDQRVELKGNLKVHSDGMLWKYEYNLEAGTMPEKYFSLKRGYPKKEKEEIKDFPGGITGGFVWKHNSKEYYFKSDAYWRREPEKQMMSKGYPKNLKIWKGVSANFDDVFSYVPTDRKREATFFFKGNKVQLFNEGTNNVDSRFPSSLRSFFGCDASRLLKGSSAASAVVTAIPLLWSLAGLTFVLVFFA